MKNNSAGGLQDDTSSGASSNVDITAGIIPALIILEVLGVPTVFLLSITLYVRAYHRDKRNQMSDFHGGRTDFSVGRTRGWWSYTNCLTGKSTSVTDLLHSDSDSDGV